MQLANYYLRLRNRFTEAQEGEPIPISLQQLANILCCTNRNTNLILKRMVDLRWIEWSSGRGRGNLSSLSFRISKESFLLDTAKQLVEKGDIRQALELLNQEEAAPLFRSEFNEWLSTQFGYRSKMEEEQQIDTLRLPLFKKRWAFDPIYAIFANEAHIIRQIFDCLVKFNPNTKQIEPQLAHHWEVSDDRTEWIFYLRKGVLFHHRRPLNASDVVFSLRRAMEAKPQSPFRWMFHPIEEIKALANYSLRIKLREPNHLFLHVLSSHAASILPEDMFHKLGSEFSRVPVGTGPFQIVTHDHSTLVLDAFNDYFQKRAHLDRVEIILLPEEYQQQFTTNDFQMRNWQPWAEKQSTAEISAEWRDSEQLQNGCVLLSFNLAKQGPQQNRLFRKALRLSIDRNKLANDHGNSIIANRLFPEYEGSDAREEFDPVAARKLLDEAGYQGEPLVISSLAHHEKDALVIKDQCNEVGIQLEITILSLNEFTRMQQLPQADIALCDVVFDENIIYAFMEYFHTEQNYVYGFLDPVLRIELQRQITTCLREPNDSQQLAGFLLLEQQFIELGIIFPLLRRKQKTYFHPAVKGVAPRSLGWTDFNDLWLQPYHLQ